MTSHVIVGGCGFLGRHVALALLRRGANVRVVDVLDYPVSELKPDVLKIDLSAAAPVDFDEIVRNADVIHHYAWTTIPSTATSDPLRDLQENLTVTIGLAEALKRRGGGRIIFSSSGGTVYGKLRSIPVPESHPLDPISAYGVSKVTAEKYLQYYHTVYGVDVRVARIANPFGAGQNPRRPQGAVTSFVYRALSEEPINIWGDGEVVRDFIHVADAASGLIALANSDSNHLEMPIYNLASGIGASINEIIRVIEQYLGRSLSVVRGAGRDFDVPISVLDITRIKGEVGWSPHLTLQEGIGRMITDLRANPDALFSSMPAEVE